MSIRVTNWRKFQHYHHRNPPWIKLHTSLLDNRGWHALSGDASKLLAECWLLASEASADGEIPLTIEDLAWRLRRDEQLVRSALYELAAQDFIVLPEVDASTPLAPRLQHATTETETETEKRKITSPNGLASNGSVENSPEVDPEPTFGDLMGLVRSELYYRDGRADDSIRNGQPWSDKRDASVLQAMLKAGVPAHRIQAAIRGFTLRRKRGDFARLADKPTMLLFWSRKEGMASFFAECERAWDARPATASIGDVLRTLTGGDNRNVANS